MLQLHIYLLLMLLKLVILEKKQEKEFSVDFHQNDYKILPGEGHIEVVRYNKKYVKYLDVVTFKYNRTTTAVNFTFRFEDLGNDLEIITQAYKFASNEYRLFPLRFEYNFCNGVKLNAFGTGNIHHCGNFTGCPLTKGMTYRLCNWKVEESRFPPFIPNGKYMLELQGVYHSVEVLVTRMFGEIDRPLIWN